MQELVIQKRLSIIPQTEATPYNQELAAQVEKFVDTLLDQGYCELKAIDGLQPLVLTFREYHDPEGKREIRRPLGQTILNKLKGKIKNMHINHAVDSTASAPVSTRNNYGVAFTELFVFDLLEQDATDPNTFVPVGYRDYRVITTSPDNSSANGQFRAPRRFLPLIKEKGFRQALEKADSGESATMNGIEISDHLRGKKLGAFLQAVAIEVLLRKGVTQIDLANSGISDDFMPLAEKLGYRHDNKKLKIAELVNADPKNLIYRFIKK